LPASGVVNTSRFHEANTSSHESRDAVTLETFLDFFQQSRT
jgi:hypothetical protein